MIKPKHLRPVYDGNPLQATLATLDTSSPTKPRFLLLQNLGQNNAGSVISQDDYRVSETLGAIGFRLNLTFIPFEQRQQFRGQLSPARLADAAFGCAPRSKSICMARTRSLSILYSSKHTAGAGSIKT